MKTIKQLGLFAFLLAATSILNFSCKSDDDGGGGGAAAEGTISAKVNGNQFNSLSMTTSGTMAGSTLSFLGSSTDGKAIQFVVNGIDGTGTYQIGGGANISVAASYTEVNINNPANTQIWQAPFDDSVAGEISFSEVSANKVKGTFSFQCKNVNGDGSVKNVTEGSFNVNLQ